MINLEEIYPYLILIGLTILAVLFQLWRQSRRANALNLSLMRLNEELDFDTLAFLDAVWGPLSRTGLEGMSWQLDWFGVPVNGQAGRQLGSGSSWKLAGRDVELCVTFYQKSRQGEQRYFTETLIETVILLLRSDILIKINATHDALAQMAKLNLFLQHDMKNIAQFIQLTADHLQATPVGSEHQTMNYLRTAIPVIRERADRIVRTLTGGQPQANPLRPYPLRDKIEQLCRLHRLDVRIEGSADIMAPRYALDSVLDNILKNYSDFSQAEESGQPLIQIEITNNSEGVYIRFESRHTPPDIQLERLFEPFWSSTPNGLGIGLYQAKQMLAMNGGKLEVRRATNGRLQFLVTLAWKVIEPGDPV